MHEGPTENRLGELGSLYKYYYYYYYYLHVGHNLPEWQAVKLTFYTLMVHYRGDKHGLEKTSFTNFRLIIQYSEIVAKLL